MVWLSGPYQAFYWALLGLTRLFFCICTDQPTNPNHDLLVCFRTKKHSISYDLNKILRLIILVFLDNIAYH